MKETLRIDFVDFWGNFYKTDNYFYHLLSQQFNVVITDKEPDILFHSVDYCNERGHLRYNNNKTKKVFYTGENQSADFNQSHFSFSFEKDSDRNYRLPLWALHLNWFNVPYNEDRDQSFLCDPDIILNKNISKVKDKKYFCSFLSSNPKGKRLEFIPKLQSKKIVHCAGRLYTNVDHNIPGRGDQIWKIQYLENFKFNISFENCSNNGYVTEKIIQPMFTNTIPIYWGAPDVGDDFNDKSFINYHNFDNDEEFIDYILKVDNDDELYYNMLNEPWFNNNEIPEFVKPKNVLSFITDVVLK